MSLPLPSYSQIIDLLKKGATLEAQELIMKLREGALELREDNLRLSAELGEAQQKVKDLEGKLQLRAKLRHESPVYYLEGDEVPYCQVCYEKDGLLSHLIVTPLDNGGIHATCKVCKQGFNIKRGVPINEPIGRSRSTWVRTGLL